jgi:hypothetical protein
VIEHFSPAGGPTYCGIRTVDTLYARFQNADESYTEEKFTYTGQGSVADEQTVETDDGTLQALAKVECDPAPPGYTWP